MLSRLLPGRARAGSKADLGRWSSGHTVSASGTSSFAGALSRVARAGRPVQPLSGRQSTSVRIGAQVRHNAIHGSLWGMSFQPVTSHGGIRAPNRCQQLAGLEGLSSANHRINIANAITPGYKAVDIDLQNALRSAQAAADVASCIPDHDLSGALAGTKHRQRLPSRESSCPD